MTTRGYLPVLSEQLIYQEHHSEHKYLSRQEPDVVCEHVIRVLQQIWQIRGALLFSQCYVQVHAGKQYNNTLQDCPTMRSVIQHELSPWLHLFHFHSDPVTSTRNF